MITKSFSTAAIAALLYSLNPAPASATQGAGCATGTEVQAAPKKKKRGFGFGGLLKAANSAGVGNLLGGGGLLGNGTAGQIAGAVAGTAVSAANGEGGSALGLMGQVSGLAGSDRVAQVAGAVTGTAMQLAQSAPKAKEGADRAAPAACPASPSTVVTTFK
ncbi:MAG TPA: hypothetical protein VEZ48_01000 [Sphingomonadaceae bacterium]|nr:hypothetical protein [Sphingomonadaceae bacterium]